MIIRRSHILIALLLLLIPIAYALYPILAEARASAFKQREIARLIDTLADNRIDPMRASTTPSVIKLVEIGDPTTIRQLLPLLSEESIPRRIHAREAICGITQKIYGVPEKVETTDQTNYQDWLLFWKSMGNYGPLDDFSEQKTKDFSRKLETWIGQWERDHKKK